jgi:Zn finger protein HypA/HybF involved in hydrogenase expression
MANREKQIRANESRRIKLRLTQDKFIERAALLHGNKFDYCLVKYVDMETEVNIICPQHGLFTQRPHQHLRPRGHGCPKCGMKQRDVKHISDTDHFIKKARLIHGDKYIYNKAEYRGINNKLIVTCPKHGDWYVTAATHLNNNKFGCPKCGVEAMSKQRLGTLEDFVAKSMSVHGDRYDYSESIYIKMDAPIRIKCKIHGYFEQEASNHVCGKGCPKCNSSTGERFIAGFLDDNNIKYIPQANIGAKNIKPCRYDFYIKDKNICIEFNGEQHYHPIKIFGGFKQFVLQLKIDAIKKWYCIFNNIKYVTIPYWEGDVCAVLKRELNLT